MMLGDIILWAVFPLLVSGVIMTYIMMFMVCHEMWKRWRGK
jgi:hypothetical protein